MTNHPVRVMVVEDHDELRDALSKALRKEGFCVYCASCAEDVDDLISHEPVSLFVIDLNLPGEDGLSLSRRLRAAYPEVGIIMATARTSIKDRVTGYDSGADLYLPKPFEVSELVAALHAMGRRIDSSSATQTTIWTLNTASNQFSGPTGQCKLSDAESRLVAAFAAARDNTLENWQVILHLVGPSKGIKSSALRFRISHLRKKMTACGPVDNPIMPLRNEGYKCPLPIQITVSVR